MRNNLSKKERRNASRVKAQEKARVINAARRLLGVGFTVTNEVVFQSLQIKLAASWNGTKAHGVELARAYVDANGGIAEVEKARPSLKARKAAARGQAVRVASAPFPVSDAFLLSYEWRRLRMEVIKERGARCECCGASPKDGIVINVDHIKPRRKYPELALTKANLQVLCGVCNHGKGNWDETDWRDPVAVMPCWSRSAG